MNLCNIIDVQLSVTQSEYIGISHDSNSQRGAVAMKECHSYNIRIYEQYHTSDKELLRITGTQLRAIESYSPRVQA